MRKGRPKAAVSTAGFGAETGAAAPPISRLRPLMSTPPTIGLAGRLSDARCRGDSTSEIGRGPRVGPCSVSVCSGPKSPVNGLLGSFVTGWRVGTSGKPPIPSKSSALFICRAATSKRAAGVSSVGPWNDCCASNCDSPNEGSAWYVVAPVSSNRLAWLGSACCICTPSSCSGTSSGPASIARLNKSGCCAVSIRLTGVPVARACLVALATICASTNASFWRNSASTRSNSGSSEDPRSTSCTRFAACMR